MVPHYFMRLAFPWQWRQDAAAFCIPKTKHAGLEAPHVDTIRRSDYFKAASVISCVQAPSGSLEMTGSEPPARSEATVRL